MQDARLKLLTVFLLSVTAFASVAGAIAVFLWWVLFSKRRNSMPSVKVFAVFFVFIGIVSLIMEYRHLSGLSYLIRMTAVLLIAGWAYTEISSSDLLNTLTWLFGQKAGFEAGLVSAIALNRMKVFSADYSRAKIALKMKNSRYKLKELIPVIGNLLIWSLRDSNYQSRVLALRGYTLGGSMHPVFKKSKKDFIPSIFSIAIFLLSVFYLVTYL
ncbi:energy-coupling factor transport system permease protein [Methanomicrobium sp. W14]|uniref:hypothetical protein n=1 Tax=Methanomicrobium sp. W14 TaxID=2817839 RepID=UPI001AEB4095|nr:hypothetical protein [Methanomicrobium sp. W14]MBP2132790.1 energy-coupling factor transport system permease protein [Methanomicrobium sp. W14]